jgi:hypothetical protein
VYIHFKPRFVNGFFSFIFELSCTGPQLPAWPENASMRFWNLRKGDGRFWTKSPIQITRKIRVFPLNIKKNLPKLATIFHYFPVFLLTVALLPGATPCYSTKLRWRRGSELDRISGFCQNPQLRNYHPTTRGEQPHNQRTPIESGISECLSTTRQYAPNTNPLLTNYSFITHSLALSLALKSSLNRWNAAPARACG